LATKIVIPDTVIKKLNDLPREIRIKFWEQIEKLFNMRSPSPSPLPLPTGRQALGDGERGL
jgi:hypothetical protein